MATLLLLNHRRSARILASFWLVTQASSGCAQATVADVELSTGVSGASSGGDASGSGGASAGSGGSDGGKATAGSSSNMQAGSGGSAGVSSGGSAGSASGAGAGGGGAGGQGGAGGKGGVGGKGGAGGSGGAPDECPNDPQKTEPGQCGCGVSEICAELEAGLAHRYSFATANMTASDSIGAAHGTIVGVSAAAGKVTFNGTADAYVNLPNGLVSSLSNASFEVWFTWAGGNPWQRIFDFGTNDQGEGNRGTGLSYIYLTPSDGDAGNALRSSYSLNGSGNETTARAATALAAAGVQHLVLVVDDAGNQIRLYLNATQVSSVAFSGALSGISDVNNWLGRSNWNDPPLNGSLDEFRIYDIALSTAQVSASQGFGPDPAFL